jgi:hypothetical protein
VTVTPRLNVTDAITTRGPLSLWSVTSTMGRTACSLLWTCPTSSRSGHASTRNILSRTVNRRYSKPAPSHRESSGQGRRPGDSGT